MRVLDTKKTIVISKNEYKKAQKYGTEMYFRLHEAKIANPTYRIHIEKSKNSSQNYKRITKSFMLGYIKTKDSDYYAEFEELFNSIGKANYDDPEGKIITFFYVRKVFLNRYPQFMTEADRAKYEAALSAVSSTSKVKMQPAATDPLSAISA